MNPIDLKKAYMSLIETFTDSLLSKKKRFIFLYKSIYVLRDDTYISQIESPNIIFSFENKQGQYLYALEGDFAYHEDMSKEENDKFKETMLSLIKRTYESIDRLQKNIDDLKKKIEVLSLPTGPANQDLQSEF